MRGSRWSQGCLPGRQLLNAIHPAELPAHSIALPHSTSYIYGRKDTMNKAQKLDLIRDTGVIAIIRAKSSHQLIGVADAIRSGGVRAIEVTMTTPGALAGCSDPHDR